MFKLLSTLCSLWFLCYLIKIKVKSVNKKWSFPLSISSVNVTKSEIFKNSFFGRTPVAVSLNPLKYLSGEKSSKEVTF